MPYRPEPMPPGATSPSIMLNIGIAAAERGVRVVERVRPRRSRSAWSRAANVAESGTPNRVSLPSIAAPTACGTVPRVGSSARRVDGAMLPSARIAITATIA